MNFFDHVDNFDEEIINNFPGLSPLPSSSSATYSPNVPCVDPSCIYYIPLGATVCTPIADYEITNLIQGNRNLIGEDLRNPIYISSNLVVSFQIANLLTLIAKSNPPFRCYQNLNRNGRVYMYNGPQNINIYFENKRPQENDYKNQKEVLSVILPDSEGLKGVIGKVEYGYDFQFDGPASVTPPFLSYIPPVHYRFKFNLNYLDTVLIYDSQEVPQETDVRYFYYEKGTKITIKNLYFRKKRQEINFNSQSQNYTF